MAKGEQTEQEFYDWIHRIVAYNAARQTMPTV
jgi:hypothetical protein